EDGQHCGLGVYKPSRRSAHPIVVPLGEPPAPVGSEARPFLRAVHIPGHLNYGADLLSRGDPRAADWCLLPQVIEQIWVRFFQGAGGPVCEQAEYLLPALVLARGRQPPTGHRRAGPPVARSASICFPPIPLLQQVLCRIADEGRGLILICPNMSKQSMAADLFNMSVQQPWELPL